MGLVPFTTVEQGAAATRQAMMRLAEQGRRYAIVDAVTDQHLLAIGEAAAQHARAAGQRGGNSQAGPSPHRNHL
ncbi:MAG: four-carbon acid sugar kinase family protein [Alphaproteobacteria bacterium]